MASDVGGVPYVVNSGVDGILVEPGDADALAEKVLAISKDAPLRREMGERARSKIVEKFSSSSLYKSYLEVYQNVKHFNS